MTSRYEATLNNVSLSSLNASLLILDISHASKKINNKLYSLANRPGSRVHKRVIESTSVTIKFELRLYSISARQAAVDSVISWAKDGGILVTNDRTGKRLRCICESFPVISSALQWTAPLEVTFTAYELPYWEDITQTTLELTGTNESGTVVVPGNALDGAYCEVDVLVNEAITSVKLSCGQYDILLSNLSVSSGQAIQIAYDDHLIQSIKVGDTSLMNKRTGADHLIAKCGDYNIMAVEADASVTATFKVRGLWL